MKRVFVLLVAAMLSLGLRAHAEVEISMGGLIEVGYEKINYEKTADKPGNLTTGDIELNIDAKLNEKVSGNILLRPDTPDEILDEATVTLENFSEKPFFITVGKTVMPFGVFNSHLISDPWTKENDLVVWETKAVGVIGGYSHKMVKVAAALYDSSDLKDPGALAGQLFVMPQDGVTFGVSYKSYYEDGQNEAGENEAFKYADLSGMVELVVDKLIINGEYSWASTRGKSAPKLSAYSAGLAFQAIDPLELALRYDILNDDDGNAVNAKSRIGGGFNYNLLKDVTLSGEYGRTTMEDDEYRNEYKAKLAIKF
jgi:hypothetical protein